MTFYEQLKLLVAESHKSFNYVERELGYPRNAFSNYRNGVEPSAKRILEIANYFNVSSEFLLGKSSDRNHKKVQVLFNKLNPERRAFILDFIQSQLDAQQTSDPHRAVVSVVRFIYRGDHVWQQEAQNYKYDIPTDCFPETFDKVFELSGADLSSKIKAHDLVFVKFDSEVCDQSFDTAPGYLFDQLAYARVITSDKRIFHIGQKNPDFAKFYDTSRQNFVHVDIVGILSAEKRNLESEDFVS